MRARRRARAPRSPGSARAACPSTRRSAPRPRRTGRGCRRSWPRRCRRAATWPTPWCARPPAATSRRCCASPTSTTCRSTPRGAGTGNYGQATPFEGGILLDLRGLTDVRIGADTVTAGAGARLSAIDKELRAAGRDIWMYPSTKTSTIGGFIGGGSAGTGSIEHLTTSDGYVVSATVAPMDGSGELFTVTGDGPRAVRPHLRGDRRARRGRGAHRPRARLDGRLRRVRLLRRAGGRAAGDGSARPAAAAGLRRRARAGADPARLGRRWTRSPTACG